MFEMWDFFREMGGLKCGVFFVEEDVFWGGKESPKGANMAGAIFGGILVLEGQDCFSGYLGNYFSDYFRTTFRTFSDYA